MASETLDPIYWPLPPPELQGSTPFAHLHGDNEGNKSHVFFVGRERVSFETLGHRIAFTATQGLFILSVLGPLLDILCKSEMFNLVKNILFAYKQMIPNYLLLFVN